MLCASCCALCSVHCVVYGKSNVLTRVGAVLLHCVDGGLVLCAVCRVLCAVHCVVCGKRAILRG